MLEKNDWRLLNQGQYLTNARLKRSEYKAPSEKWDHDHCSFCWDKFSESDGDLHLGYCTLDGKFWICDECFDDFKDMLRFELQ